MTFTSSAPQNGSGQFSPGWRLTWRAMLASRYIRGKPRCGTELVWSPKRAAQCRRLRSVWTLTPQCGLVMVLCPNEVSAFWGSQSAHQSLCEHNSRICRTLGSSSSSVPTHAHRIRCAGCLPQESEHFATEHDTDSRRSLSLLLGVTLTQDSWEKSSLRMSTGGGGLRSASRTAYWASWTVSLRMIHQRHPAVADQMVHSLT